MALIALGLNHLCAPVALRERAAFSTDDTVGALGDLVAQPGVREAVILSTCNRTELYCNVDSGAESSPFEWLHRHQQLHGANIDEFLYRHTEADAVRHLFRVATGLESMVLGEPQILGQVKGAYNMARDARTLDAPLERLFQNTFSVAKRVRSDTSIGTNPVSVAFTAVRLAERVFTDLANACVLLVGAGETIELAARHLTAANVQRLIVANRTLDNAQALAGRFGGYAIALSDLERHLAEADIVISSTAAREPVIGREMVARAIAARRSRPMFLVDLAVPRDIETEVAKLPNVFLYSIDDLREVIDENLRSRQQAAVEAEAMIELSVEHFMTWWRALELNNPIASIRRNAEASRDEALAKARNLLARGKSADQALEFLAHTLTNKLVHAPSANLRAAALRGDSDLLQAAERLFDAPARETESR
ncbi:MAG: glutamyl-tRNA reductase [Dokdonella sp.]|jgi:glutamyl-tRNA reductase|uniref:glutamyl-tRNA reductase n=1 Tax=Dokdonella sp. TaxID=2291710 RepID=UPI001B4A21E4|nr:glutamyl-tRNA reductase [Dokdonella sp.]MBK8122810.1 glutamyl-tRNA reductase [Dokdonella sp.]MBP6326109.1 glutamyl-tRNA reductase [Dokdonella sp.]MBP6330814.1 glutamyl-tRNA reductase [Dokdonella sp.]HPW04862.1 glutamyl-tRNA reductase [Dokdonella sp.]HQV49333.1 glutamyl-tRNA reductase [Dokdonella sp.]